MFILSSWPSVLDKITRKTSEVPFFQYKEYWKFSLKV